MASNAERALRSLSSSLRERSPAAAGVRLAALRALSRARLERSGDVERLHDAACFVRAYPESPAELEAARALLAGFAERPDLRRHRRALEATGIAGTSATYSFHWFTAEWLTRRWPGLVSVAWSWVEPERLDPLVYPILLEHERLAYEGSRRSLNEILDLLRAPGETDAEYLIGAFRRLATEPLLLEEVYDALDLSLRLAHGPGAPSLTHAVHPVRRVHFGSRGSPRASGSPAQRIARAPLAVRRVAPRTGRELIELGRLSLVLRGRDLFAFMHGNPADVVVADYPDGLQFACIGLAPEHRHLLLGQHVLLALQNGVPIGYVQACTLFDSAEVNFNVFSTYRDGDASRVLTSSLSLMRHLLGVDAFGINTHQLGEENPEAIETGAWWFYHKHGFRPVAREGARLERREVAAKRDAPGHRSSRATLERLSQWPLFLFLGRTRRDVVGLVDTAAVGERVVRTVAARTGASGERAVRAASRMAAERLGVTSRAGWMPAQREAWRRWAPLVVALPGIERWSRSERRALVEIVRAKGARHELDSVLRMRRHGKLRAALLEPERGRPARRRRRS